MKVSEFFRRLSFAELSNLAIGVDGAGAIEATQQDRIIHFINEGLLRLHSKFPLREEGLVIRTRQHITNYHLKRRYAESNPDRLPGDEPYIRDSASPFREDVIKILQVFGPDGMLPLNDVNDLHSVFTPQPNILQVPAPQEMGTLELSYQTSHPLIQYGDLDACIDVPMPLEGALQAYVAYQVYSFMNGQDTAAKAQEHMARYEYICAEVEKGDLVSSSISTSDNKFSMRGFV